jgi:hypothetical protein
LTGIQQLHVANTGMASAVTQAISRLVALDNHERRIERLESAVFPPKH